MKKNTTLNNGKYYSSMQLVCNAWKHNDNVLCSRNYYYSIICTTSILDIAPTDIVVGKNDFFPSLSTNSTGQVPKSG